MEPMASFSAELTRIGKGLAGGVKATARSGACRVAVTLLPFTTGQEPLERGLPALGPLSSFGAVN